MIETIKELLNYKLIDTDNVDIRVSTFVILFLVLIITAALLRFIRVFATRKLPLEDKNKFIKFTFRISAFWAFKSLI